MVDTGDALLDELIDGLLHGGTSDLGSDVTYTFDLPSDIASDWRNSMLNNASIARHLEVFAEVTALTGLQFTEVDGRTQSADFYFSFRRNTSTAYVYEYDGGVMHVYNPKRDTPVLGAYTDHLIIHELGHGLGLEHGHDADGLPAAYQGESWSVMSYRSHPDSNRLYYETEHGPETYMIADIAALQYLHGANFETQSDDTLYEVNFATGELLINGQSQGVPINEKIQRAIWDGAGNDTLDLSNGVENMTINLQPGAFTSFGDIFLPDVTGEGKYYAEGNLANPYLYQGNTSSLLENAIGGQGQDLIVGNVLNNQLTGGDGADSLFGMAGDDMLFGGNGDDLIVDGLGNTSASGEAGNDVIAALSGESSLSGNSGDDILIGGIDGDTLFGGAGDDKIRGEGGRGLLFGDDNIDGGQGDDLLMGGRGADQFVFRPNDGDDIIAGFTVGGSVADAALAVSPETADFSVGVDKIVLSNFDGIDATNVLDYVTTGSNGAVFAAQGTTITFFGVSAQSLTVDDFEL